MLILQKKKNTVFILHEICRERERERRWGLGFRDGVSYNKDLVWLKSNGMDCEEGLLRAFCPYFGVCVIVITWEDSFITNQSLHPTVFCLVVFMANHSIHHLHNNIFSNKMWLFTIY